MNNLPSAGSKAVAYQNCSFRGAQTMCGPVDCRVNRIIYSTTTATEPLPMSA